MSFLFNIVTKCVKDVFNKLICYSNPKMELLTKTEGNPWMVDKLEEFLYFCCPECDEKSQMKDSFLQHALFTHPNVSPFQFIVLHVPI